MSTFTRVDYSKADNRPSSAYYNPTTKEAFDVYDQMPVRLTELGPNTFVEWTPPARVEPEPEPTVVAVKPAKDAKPTPVVMHPLVAVWQLPVIFLFGIAMIWLTIEFGKMTP